MFYYCFIKTKLKWLNLKVKFLGLKVKPYFINDPSQLLFEPVSPELSYTHTHGSLGVVIGGSNSCV